MNLSHSSREFYNLKLILILTIWMFIPRSFASPPEAQLQNTPRDITVDELLERAMIIVNGKTVPLGVFFERNPRASYQPVYGQLLQYLTTDSPMAINFPPADLDARCLGGSYVNRKLISNLPPAPSTSREFPDTATLIARDLANYVSTHPDSIPITMIIGEPGTGKSTTLLKIQHELINLVPTCWCIKVDLSWIVQLGGDYDTALTYHSIIGAYLPPGHDALMENVLIVNPQKIVVLFDGVDTIPEKYMPKFVELIADWTNVRIVAVTAGRRYNINMFNELNVQRVTYTIPELQVHEAAEMLNNIWTAEINSNIFTGDKHTVRGNLDEYAAIFTHVLYKTPIPRQPSMLPIVAKLLSSRDQTNRMSFPVDYTNYIFHPNPPLRRLRQALEANHRKQFYFMSKNVLYEHLFETEHHKRLTADVPTYGSLAVHQLITEYEESATANSLLKPILSDVNDAKLALVPLREENKFFTITNGVLKFNHPEYQRYISMDYLRKTLIHKLNDPRVLRLVLQLFIKPYYRYLLEFATGHDWSPLIDRIDSGHLVSLLNNVIGNGLDLLYRNIHERLIHNNRLAEVQNYFLDNHAILSGPDRAFGMLQTEQNDLIVSPLTRYALNSLIDSIFHYDMVHTMRALHSSNILISNNVNGQRLFHITVTQPWPNLQLCKNVANFLYAIKVVHLDLDSLLYDVINQVGPGSEEIALYLQDLGARPSVRITNDQTLLHAAVQWSDAAFVRFVVETLKQPSHDSPDRNGRTVFAMALDANPTPSVTTPNWWQMMEYLVSRVNLLSLPSKSIVQNENIYKIPLRDFTSPWLHFMTGWQSTILPIADANGEYNAHEVNINIISQTEPKKYYYWTLIARAIPSHLWQVSPQTRQLRLNLLLHKLYSTIENPLRLEVLIAYGGSTILTNSEHYFYRATVNQYYQRCKSHMSVKTYIRLVTTLVNNAVGGFDPNALTYVMTNPIIQALDQPVRMRLYQAIHDMLGSHPPTFGQTNLLWALTNRRLVEFDQVELASNLEPVVHLTVLPDSVIYDDDADPALCLARRSRRALTIPKVCLYGWNDIDRFSSTDHGRDPTKIQIDSEQFVKYLAASESSDASKSRQLVNLVQYLENKATPSSILSGNSQMFVKDILKHGSLTDYRKYQQTVSAINDRKFSTREISSRTKFPSQTVALYAITGLSLVRSAFAAMDACSEHRNDSRCLFASSALAVTAVQIPASYLASRYVPWIIDKFSATALETLPSRALKFLRENLQLMRTTTGMKIAGRLVGVAIGLPGLCFELYTVAHLSMMVDLCNRGDSKCTSRDRIESVIMLTFSCTSVVIGIFMLMATGVGIWIGVAIGLAIEIFQSIALGINDVIYYHQRYGTRFNENVRLFASRIGFIPSLRDVEDLARDSEWMDLLEEKATKFLSASDAAIVGYAVGIGRTVRNGVQASSSSIDLNSESAENTRKLSRILPRPRSMTEFLCLPRQRNITLYNDVNYATSIPSVFTQSAVHRCRNSFVLGHRVHLDNTTSQSTVVYDMALISRGEVIASNTYSNVFLVHGGTALIKGSVNTTNIYRMMNDSFQGGIVLQGKSQNTLDLSALVSPVVTFFYNPKWKMGSIQTGESQQSSFTIATRDSISPELHVIGRTGQPENYECNRSKKLVTPTRFTIDGNGGSASQMDHIVDCSITIIRPFTSVSGSADPNTTRMVFVPLNYSSPSRHPGMKSSRAVLHPLQSKFIMTFTGRPLLIGTHDIKYYKRNKTLSWEFSDGPLSTMTLSIKSYRAPHVTDDYDSSRPVFDDRMVNCMFVDNFTNAIIYPLLDLLDNETDVISVRHLDVVTWINSSRLVDVVMQYQKIKPSIADKFIVHKLIDSTTGKSFSFGSTAGDRFYADANTTFIFGGDGSDIYSFNSLSPECVWLDNSARDNATDTIVVSADVCTSIVASVGSEDSQSTRGSDEDITLTCFRESSSPSPYTKIILRDYVFESRSRHLQIYWRDNLYVPVVRHRQEQLYLNGDYTADLALVFSFDDWTNTMLTPTSEDSCIVVKTSSDVTNPLVAYRSKSSMILTRKYLDNLSPSFILFEDFFLNEGISFHWRNLTVFEVHETFDSVDNARELSARDLQSLLVTSDPKQDDFIVEYSVDMSNVTQKTIIINHNNESTAYKKLGILRLLNVRPGDLKANWSVSTASLLLCASDTCVHVRDWCTGASHRLYRIDFVLSLDQPAIVVQGLHRLNCHESKNNRKRTKLIKKLNDMLAAAEKSLQLSAANGETDESRLITCLGINLASISINSSMPQLFGFDTEFEEACFVRDNCQALYSQGRLDQLTLKTFQTALENKIKKYFIFRPKNATHPSIVSFQKQLQTLDDILWKKYLALIHPLVQN